MGRVARKMKSWNLFRDAPETAGYGVGMAQSPRQSRSPGRYFSDKSIVTSIYTRMALDFAQIEFFHAKLDPKQDVAIDVIRDSLHYCLSRRANIDQTALMLKMDIAMTAFEHGVACVIPIEADMDPLASESYNISDMRVGRIVGWFPRHVTVEVYDDRDVDGEGQPINGGISKQLTWPKKHCAIIENPFYNVMNEPNGLLQRLMRKLAILDGIDEAAGSGKLDLIVQLPYATRLDSKKREAEARRALIAEQLKDDELGIAYVDVSEKVIQLNRPIENKLLDQIQLLFDLVRAELGITQAIMDSSADGKQINAYMDRTIEPIGTAVSQEFSTKFLTKTAQTQRHSIEMFRDPLKLIPLEELSEIIDKARRNGVLSANEIRPKIGFMPSDEEGANSLGNPNLKGKDREGAEPPPEVAPEEVTDEGLPDEPAE